MRKIILSIGLLAYLSFLNFQCRGPEKELKTVSDVDTVEQELAVELDSATGLVIDEGFQLVKGNCTPCHSARLITQNRASREGWKEMIQWMQETQNLWPLGQNVHWTFCGPSVRLELSCRSEGDRPFNCLRCAKS